jgi:hypothetical protein
MLREKKKIGDGIWSSYIQAVPLVKGGPRNCTVLRTYCVVSKTHSGSGGAGI